MSFLLDALNLLDLGEWLFLAGLIAIFVGLVLWEVND